MKSSKKYISEYIVLKILKGDYKIHDIVSSENRLAIKFKCSRLTARSALINLVGIGLLDSFKGMGYLVSERAIDILFFAKSLKNKSISSTFNKIEELNISDSLKKLNKNECEIFLIKNKNAMNNLLSMSFIIIDKIILDKFYKNNYNFADYNPIESIIDSTFIPSSTFNNYLSERIIGHDASLLELGYDPDETIPMIDQWLLDESGNCAIRTFNIQEKSKLIYSNFNKILVNSYNKKD